MDSKNSKISDLEILLLILADKINLTRSNKYAALSKLGICYTWKNMKKSYKNNEFKIWAPTWNEEFELPDGSYSISDMLYQINKITKNENGQNVPNLEIAEVVLVHFNTVNNNYQQNSIVLQTVFQVIHLVNY